MLTLSPPPPPTATPDVASVISTVAWYFNLRPAEIRSRLRHRHIAHPRMVCMYLIRRLTRMPLETIGAAMNRDHATIIYGVRTVEKMMETDDLLASQVRYLEQYLKEAFRAPTVAATVPAVA